MQRILRRDDRQRSFDTGGTIGHVISAENIPVDLFADPSACRAAYETRPDGPDTE